MKSDKYLKIILAIIAICLIWICIRDIRVGDKSVYSQDVLSVRLVEISHEYGAWEAITVIPLTPQTEQK